MGQLLSNANYDPLFETTSKCQQCVCLKEERSTLDIVEVLKSCCEKMNNDFEIFQNGSNTPIFCINNQIYNNNTFNLHGTHKKFREIRIKSVYKTRKGTDNLYQIVNDSKNGIEKHEGREKMA